MKNVNNQNSTQTQINDQILKDIDIKNIQDSQDIQDVVIITDENILDLKTLYDKVESTLNK